MYLAKIIAKFPGTDFLLNFVNISAIRRGDCLSGHAQKGELHGWRAVKCLAGRPLRAKSTLLSERQNSLGFGVVTREIIAEAS